jgi:hypothetical protein
MASIASLIYKSTAYADAVYASAREFSPGHRFFFVANDATDEVLAHLARKGYPFVVQENAKPADMDGWDPPEYIRRVYMGWNRAILESDEQCILVNSDCMFSPGWDHALLSRLWPTTVVCSKIVERKHPKHGVFSHAYECDFGDHPSRFDRDGFLDFAARISRRETSPAGAFMPCALHRSVAIHCGLYPEGNRNQNYGDREFFARLAQHGVEHVTALDSIVYHFKEGEMRE